MLLKHQTARARPGTTAAGSQRAQLPACWLAAPHTAAQLSAVKAQITQDLARNPITRAQSHCYEVSLPSRWEAISPQMANIPQVEQGGEKKKRLGQRGTRSRHTASYIPKNIAIARSAVFRIVSPGCHST